VDHTSTTLVSALESVGSVAYVTEGVAGCVVGLAGPDRRVGFSVRPDSPAKEMGLDDLEEAAADRQRDDSPVLVVDQLLCSVGGLPRI
jgi:hypothetical protein